MQYQPLICPGCRKVCQLIVTQSNIGASEHYCVPCHKSYPVPEIERERELAQRRVA